MRVPLSWLRDFAPFDREPAELAATLDDLGLVVEGTELVGEGLDDIVVARVEEISAIEGADRIRRVVVDAGDGPVEVVCGAWNFDVGDLVPLAPVGAVLPGGFAIGRRKMKGVVSNGMLCSGRELGLSEDHEGIMVLNGVEGAIPGRPFAEALGIERDVCLRRGRGGQPARRLEHGRRGPRPGCSPWAALRHSRTGAAAAPGPVGGHTGLGPTGGQRAVPALCRTGHDRCHGGAVARLAGPPLDPGRHAADQQRGGRVQLRDARAGATHPSL